MSIHSLCKNSGKFQHFLYHHSNSIKYFMYWCVAHESTGGDDFIFLINMSLIHVLTDVLAAKLRNSFCSVWNIWIPIIFVMANSDFTAWENLCSQHRRDAAQANGLLLGMEGLQDCFNLLIDRAVFALDSPATQVLGCAKATREDDGIQVLYIELREVLDITPGKSGTLHEHISLFLCWGAFQVIDNMHLISVGCKYLDSSLLTAQMNQNRRRLVDFTSIEHTAACQHYSHTLSHVSK